MSNHANINPNIDKYIEAETVSEDSNISSLNNFDEVSEVLSPKTSSYEILLIEPFYGGSHKQLIDTLDFYLRENLPEYKPVLFSLPAKKWHWRARTSALYFSKVIPKNSKYKVLFCSSVLNLAELIALRLDLAHLFKIVYFHENQLCYPVQKFKDRDFQYGYNQILTSLVADIVIFNSYYNMNSFLQNLDRYLKLQPDYCVTNLSADLLNKCKVIYFPVEVPVIENEIKRNDVLHIIWPHRWEHDKNPELFFNVLIKLKANNFLFKLSVLGETFKQVPDIFNIARETLKGEILHFGNLTSKSEYFRVLKSGHVVVSTASHEFFGVAMFEAVLLGCFPLACNKLVYPEIYPSECLYNTPNQLFKKLKNLCQKPYLAEVYLKKAQINFEKFNAEVIMKDFRKLFCDNYKTLKE